MDGRRWGAARPTGKPRASPPPALRHLGLSAARCRPRPLSWWGALGTWWPRAVAPLPALTASTPLSTHAPSRHPSGFSGLLTPPLSPGRTNPEGPTSPRSGALRRPGLAPRRLGHVGSGRPAGGVRSQPSPLVLPPPFLCCSVWSHHTWPCPPPGQRSRAEPHPGPATAPARGGRTEAVAPFWTFPFSAEKGAAWGGGPRREHVAAPAPSGEHPGYALTAAGLRGGSGPPPRA